MTSFSKFATLAICGTSLLIPALPSSAQISSQGRGYLLRIKYVKNAKTNYKMTSTNPMTGAPLSSTMSTLVKSVSGRQATVQYTMTQPAGMGQGGPTKVDVVVDDRGKVIKGAPGGAQLGNVELPEGPVAIGATWSTNVNAMPGLAVTTRYKVVGTKLVGGQQCLQLGISMSSANKQMSLAGTGASFLRMSDGSMQSLSLNLDISVSMPGKDGKTTSQKLKQTVAIVRT